MRILEKLTLFTAMCLVGALLLIDSGGSAIARAFRLHGESHSSVTTEIVIVVCVAIAICAVLRLLGRSTTQPID